MCIYIIDIFMQPNISTLLRLVFLCWARLRVQQFPIIPFPCTTPQPPLRRPLPIYTEFFYFHLHFHPHPRVLSRYYNPPPLVQ